MIAWYIMNALARWYLLLLLGLHRPAEPANDNRETIWRTG